MHGQINDGLKAKITRRGLAYWFRSSVMRTGKNWRQVCPPLHPVSIDRSRMLHIRHITHRQSLTWPLYGSSTPASISWMRESASDLHLR